MSKSQNEWKIIHFQVKRKRIKREKQITSTKAHTVYFNECLRNKLAQKFELKNASLIYPENAGSVIEPAWLCVIWLLQKITCTATVPALNILYNNTSQKVNKQHYQHKSGSRKSKRFHTH